MTLKWRPKSRRDGLRDSAHDGNRGRSINSNALGNGTLSLEGVEDPEQKKAMTERCDKLGQALTAEQLKKAEPLIQEWKAKGTH